MHFAWLKMAYVCATACLISTGSDVNCNTMSVCWDPGKIFLETQASVFTSVNLQIRFSTQVLSTSTGYQYYFGGSVSYMIFCRCMNGGTCIDGVDNFTCSCPPMLTGPLCECLILEDDSFDCQYVSPTPLSVSTQTDLFTTFSTELITTEMITTSYSGYNETIPRTSTTAAENETLVTSTISSGSTVLEGTETTTDQSVSESSTMIDSKDITTITLITTEKGELETARTITSQTIGVDDSKTETTTECLESCERSTVSTNLTPTLATETTTSYANETISTDLITMVTTKETFTTTGKTTATATPELTTTPIIDITTEKIFTETPTEHVLTDVPIVTTISSTEATEVTTASDNTTYIFTTVEPVCTDDICNNHGTCANTLHGIRVSTSYHNTCFRIIICKLINHCINFQCHCAFNYGGRYCEEKISITSAAFGENTFITHKLDNTTLINVTFNAKTLITDGQMMHVDIANGVYMQLYMTAGLLKFKFSCGYQTMLLSELNTYVNKGYLMKIETRYVGSQFYKKSIIKINH